MGDDISGWGEQDLTASAFLSQAQRSHGLLGDSECAPRAPSAPVPPAARPAHSRQPSRDGPSRGSHTRA